MHYGEHIPHNARFKNKKDYRVKKHYHKIIKGEIIWQKNHI
ncbi:hypothetical protein MNV_1100020 [Candidatus Methanoperedens nitroreducens]|uniref:Uncharacterized protein n=1 Tax=Candidatus Methanoperedens nitratireducens TaxID=1392998 RepID=A0A284VJ13_9EURY|nr:hypothetical protein MNV_1100020 [Candidatus Methanoperedens nitroreducens]